MSRFAIHRIGSVFLACLLLVLALRVALPAGTPAPAKKSQPPTAAAQAKALALIRSVFRADYDKARTDEAARRALAATLLEEGRKTKDDAALRFVALRQAYELATQVGDLQTALQAVAELASGHAVDSLKMKAAAITRAAELPPGRVPAQTLVQATLAAAAEAVDADDHETARRLALTAADVAGKGGLRALQMRARAERQRIERLAKEFARVRPAVEVLRRDPEDPTANLALGKYRCLVQGRWRQGLALLARCGDPAWRALARSELAEPDTAARQAALGDAWWERAAVEKGAARFPLLRRAYHWYREALPELDETARARVHARVADLLDEVPYLIVGEIRQLQGPAAPAAAVAFAPDGRFVYAVGGDAFVHKAEVRTGKEVARFEGHTEEIWAVAVSPDGKRVLSGGKDGVVRLWDADTGKELRRLEGHERAVRAVAFAPDGRHAASGCEDRTVRLWDLTAGRETGRCDGHTRSVEGLAFAHDGKRLLSASWDRTLRLWDVANSKEVRRFTGHTAGVYRVALSPEGKRAVSGGGDDLLRLWDVASGKEVRALAGHTGHVIGVAFSPDGTRVLSGGGDDDNSVRLWEVETGQQLHHFTGHTQGVWGVAFSPDGRRAVSCSEDGTVRLWGLPP
jgi:hypothetical protein